MTEYIKLSAFSAIILIAIACSGGSSNSTNHSELQNVSTEVYYTCTMHPEVHSDKPGKCPICNMELVKKEIVESDSTLLHHHTDRAEHHH